MHKKVQSLILAGIISTNTVVLVGQVFANEIRLGNVSGKEDIQLDEWEYTEEDDVVVITKYKGNRKEVIIPRTINNKPVELKDFTNDMFLNVTDISIEKSEDDEIKIQNIDLQNAFKDNKTIESLDLEGLNTDNITNLSNIFEGCDNLRFLNLAGWDTTNTEIDINPELNVIKVSNEQGLLDALKESNSKIILGNNIVLTNNIEISRDANNKVITGVELIGNGYSIDCNEKYKITFKTTDTKISGVTFKNYLNTAISLYGAKNVELNDITLEGNDTELSNDNRSKIGMDITNATVTINNIISKNHTYRGLQVKQNSNVNLNGVKHINDSIHLQSISNSLGTPTITMKNNEYKEIKESVITNGDKLKDYYTKEEISITSAQELLDNSKNTGTVLLLKNDITFPVQLETRLRTLDSYPYPQYETLSGIERDLNLNIFKNINIKGNGNTIDLNNVCGLVLKGDDSLIEDVKVINSASDGIAAYNSKGVKLDKVTIENSAKSGIVANGSIVEIANCITRNNGDCGVMSTRSRTLDNQTNPDIYRDSLINITGTFEQQEPNKAIVIRNLEMIKTPCHKQNNKVIFASTDVKDRYNTIDTPEVKAQLSLMDKMIFKEWFEENDISFETEFGTTDTNYIKKQTKIDVTKSNSSTITLDNTGQKDVTEELKELLRYATLNSNELYFPKGTYKISGDIDLTKLDTAAFSNVTITGDESGLSIIDASSINDKMVLIKNNDYHSKMGYVNIKNMVFNNVGLEFNGIYKNDISLNNNVFMNGRYTTKDGKATMTPYITANNSTYSIERNIFLRGKDYAGRGISTYATKDSVIKENFFGKLEGKDDAIFMIPELATKLNLVNKTRNISGEQGNFFTCINNERYDKNMTIENNYMHMNDSREIEGVETGALISGIDVLKDGQIKDHLIYSKSYEGLNIVGNYFKGMENGASGGVKLRNGVGAYVGANHFKDVPLLTYIYGDLTKEECKLYDTTIYNNVFHETKNIGQEGTGILYYQSFKNGETVTFPDGTVDSNMKGDVKNFAVYNNKFLSGKDSVITISNRSEDVKNEFYINGNIYAEKEYSKELVNYNRGNLTIEETEVNTIKSKLNNGYTVYENAQIPLYPTKVDSSQLQQEVSNFAKYLNNVKDDISKLTKELHEQITQLIKDAAQLIQDTDSKQYDINNKIIEIKKFTKNLNDSINVGDDTTINPEVPSVPSVPTVTLKDIKGHWAEEQIQLFVNKGFISGYENSTFKPNDSMTRAEFVKVVNKVFGYTQKGEEQFTDVNKDDWFYNDICIAVKAGYIKGRTKDMFDPNAKITREEAAMIVTTIMNNKDESTDKLNKFKDGNKTSEWAKSSMAGAIEAGYIKGDDKGRLNPTKNMTRAEVISMLSRLK